jgi:phospholipase/carboxylesterase
MSHGTDDKMISVSEARSAKQYLSAYNQNIDYNEYKDGHTINNEMLNDFIQWLNSF